MKDDQKAQEHCSYLKRYLNDLGRECHALVNQIRGVTMKIFNKRIVPSFCQRRIGTGEGWV
jgi:hypothetical protein